MNPSVQATDAQLSDDARVAELLDELANRLQTGEAVDVEAFLTAHPEHAERLRRLVPAAQVLAELEHSGPVSLPAAGEAAEPAPGLLGDFRILRPVGRGGMGVVYEALQVSLGRRVALKVLPFAGALDPRQLQRFKNEAQAAAQLQHQHIVPVYFVGQDRGVHYYAMQFIDGHTLAAVIAELRAARGGRGDEAEATGPYVPRPQPPEAAGDGAVREAGRAATVADRASRVETAAGSVTPVAGGAGAAYFRWVARLAEQAAEALEHAHELGVIHRDIKPANLMVDGRGNLWVTDFGLARVQAEAGLTQSGDLLGTLRYMSPEQALARRVVVDQRTDVYSLGVTLYELLTLEPAYDGKDRQELLRQISFEEPRRLRYWDRAIPAELETIVLKAMEKNPADRYGTAQELADDLRRFQEDRPIEARRPTIVQRANKWLRRHRGLAWAAVLFLAAAVVVLAGSTAWVWHEKGQKEAALEAEKQARRDADARAAETKAVLEFVENRVFAAARPTDLGPQVTLRKAVEAALPFVDRSFTDQPLIEGRLRLTLAKSFWYLGDAKLAAEQCEAARALYTQHLGPYHPDTLSSMNNLAIGYRALGRYQDARKLFEETLALQKAWLGPDHPDTLRSMGNLASSYQDLGRHADARKLREETLALMKAKLGPDHPDTLLSMMNLASSVGDLKLREETLALMKAKLGPDHPDTLGNMHNLANSYFDLGRHADALRLYKETLALMKAKLGPDHPNTFMSMNGLANCYYVLGRHVEAFRLHEQTLALKKAKLGPDHPDTLLSMTNLASSYHALGRDAEALKLRQETLARQKAKLGPDHPDTLVSMNNLANSYSDVGRHADALKLRKETLALREAKLGPDHPDTLFSMWTLALTLVALDRGQEAVRIIDECQRRATGKRVDPGLLTALMDVRLRHFAKRKDAAGCRQTAEMYEKLQRTDAGSLYDAACMRAVTAAVIRGTDLKSVLQAKPADAEADRAMAWLKQAVAAGYKDVANMKKDPDLNALRDREDFKKLLTELGAEAKP